MAFSIISFYRLQRALLRREFMAATEVHNVLLYLRGILVVVFVVVGLVVLVVVGGGAVV